MTLFLQLVLNGIVNGSHYALLGVGFGLIFGTTNLVHFAYGPVVTNTGGATPVPVIWRANSSPLRNRLGVADAGPTSVGVNA